MTSNRGIPFLAVDWALLLPLLLAFCIRMYSRGFLTRSLGSDDVAICFPIILTTVGSVLNIFEVQNGLGTHQRTLSDAEYAEDQQWEYIAWVAVFVSFFFVRTSVMLFVLRLLPPFKKWQQKVVYVTFILNFVITIIATVSYGVSCIPIRATWMNVPGSKCVSKKVLVATQKMNGGLSCAIDITVALIPAFILWNVQMRRKTKIVLNILFILGLVTAAMSIGRAATTNYENLTTDTTWKLMPNKWFGMIEEKCGITFACGPAVRQFFAYRSRTGTFLPSAERRPRNEDFNKMRRRITLRDIFWFRPNMLSDSSKSTSHPSSDPTSESRQTDMAADIDATAKTSVLDMWWGRLFRAVPGPSSRSNNHSTVDTGKLKENKRPLTDSAGEERSRIWGKYKKWGLLRNTQTSDSSSRATSTPFLLTDSGTSAANATGHQQHSRFGRDNSLGEVLADPVRSLVPAEQRFSSHHEASVA